MHVAFIDARAADTHKLRFGAQIVNGLATRQAHARAQAAHLLVHDLFQAAFVGNAAFDTFRYQFVSGVIALEVTI